MGLLNTYERLYCKLYVTTTTVHSAATSAQDQQQELMCLRVDKLEASFAPCASINKMWRSILQGDVGSSKVSMHKSVFVNKKKFFH